VPFTRRGSAHAARRSNSPSSFPPPRRAPSSAPSSPRKRRRPRKGYAERVDRRHGSLASSHDRRNTRSRSSRTKAVSAFAPDRQNSQRAETPIAGERGGALPGIERMVQIISGGTGCASSEWARPVTVVLAGSRQEIRHPRETVGEGKRGPRREPRAEEDSRLAGVPARRTCVAEIGSAIAAQRSPCENFGNRISVRASEPCTSRV
jgi:hypothetical protein